MMMMMAKSRHNGNNSIPHHHPSTLPTMASFWLRITHCRDGRSVVFQLSMPKSKNNRRKLVEPSASLLWDSPVNSHFSAQPWHFSVNTTVLPAQPPPPWIRNCSMVIRATGRKRSGTILTTKEIKWGMLRVTGLGRQGKRGEKDDDATAEDVKQLWEWSGICQFADFPDWLRGCRMHTGLVESKCVRAWAWRRRRTGIWYTDG